MKISGTSCLFKYFAAHHCLACLRRSLELHLRIQFIGAHQHTKSTGNVQQMKCRAIKRTRKSSRDAFWWPNDWFCCYQYIFFCYFSMLLFLNVVIKSTLLRRYAVTTYNGYKWNAQMCGYSLLSFVSYSC